MDIQSNNMQRQKNGGFPPNKKWRKLIASTISAVTPLGKRKFLGTWDGMLKQRSQENRPEQLVVVIYINLIYMCIYILTVISVTVPEQLVSELFHELLQCY